MSASVFGSTRPYCACCHADDPGHEEWCPYPGVEALSDADLEAAAVAAVVEMASCVNPTRPWWIACCRVEEIGRRLMARGRERRVA